MSHSIATTARKSEFWNALLSRDVASVHAFLQSDPSLIHSQSSCSWRGRPLLWACRRGRTQMAAVLLQAGAPIHDRDNRGWTALWWAVCLDHVDIVKMLVEADPSVVHDEPIPIGPSLVYLAMDRSSIEAVKILLEAGVANIQGSLLCPAVVAVESDRLDLLEIVLKHVSPQENLLHRATTARMVKALVHKHKFDLNRHNQAGFTPLHTAAQAGNGEVLDALIEQGADLEARVAWKGESVGDVASNVDVLYRWVRSCPMHVMQQLHVSE